MENTVRKATRLDYTPPKQKHLQTLVNETFTSTRNAADIIDLLEKRLRENSWIIIFKVLITIHTLMRDGNKEEAIKCVETNPSALDTSRLREKSSGVVHIQNIYFYTAYLEQKVIAYRNLGVDYVKAAIEGGDRAGGLRHLSVKDGLLKNTIALQKQMNSLLKCREFILDVVDSSISLYAFKLLVNDLLALFQIINESIINILEHYFAMDKPDARTSLEIYKRFAKQAQDTILFLDKARGLGGELNLSIPDIKHAPLSLAVALQEYLDDTSTTTVTTTIPPQPQSQPNNFAVQSIGSNNNHVPQQPKELIDFFASIENEQVQITYNPMAQQKEVMFPSSMNFVQPQTTHSSPLGMGQQGGFVQPQHTLSSPLSIQPTGHNPFRTETTGVTTTTMALMIPQQQQQPHSTMSGVNPFRSNTMPITQDFFTHDSLSLVQQPINTGMNQMNNPFAVNSHVTNNTYNPFAATAAFQKPAPPQTWGSSVF